MWTRVLCWMPCPSVRPGAGQGVDEKEGFQQALANHSAVSCTPNIGVSTKEAQKRIGEKLVDIVERFMCFCYLYNDSIFCVEYCKISPGFRFHYIT